jgi:hypothetical protein
MPLVETTLSEDIIVKVCSHLRKHGFRETAIAMAGVSKFTVRNWIRHGARDVREGKESIFADFVNRMDEAEQIAESELIEGIAERGLNAFVRSKTSRTDDNGNSLSSESLEPPDWKALAWIAERRGAKRWGIKKHLTVAIDKDREKLLHAAERTLDPDAYSKLLEALIADEESSNDGAGETSEDSGES